jgi:hypothetical protein
MLRDDDLATFSGGEGSPEVVPAVRQSAAESRPMVLRLIVAPFAVVAAAIAGLLFAALLPICGIATICEGIAKTSWRFLRQASPHVPQPPPRRI